MLANDPKLCMGVLQGVRNVCIPGQRERKEIEQIEYKPLYSVTWTTRLIRKIRDCAKAIRIKGRLTAYDTGELSSTLGC